MSPGSLQDHGAQFSISELFDPQNLRPFLCHCSSIPLQNLYEVVVKPACPTCGIPLRMLSSLLLQYHTTECTSYSIPINILRKKNKVNSCNHSDHATEKRSQGCCVNIEMKVWFRETNLLLVSLVFSGMEIFEVYYCFRHCSLLVPHFTFLPKNFLLVLVQKTH